MSQSYDHFKGHTAVDHVIEAQAKGIVTSSEIHGTEIPGFISAATDAARETTVLILMISLLSNQLSWLPHQTVLIFTFFLFGWLIWKTGRSAWLGWSRLERLHRVLEEERWEIEHNRTQERDELKALYAAKGFEGRLLEEVLDVLMADGDRLLKVMLEEELGLSLQSHEHPLKQSLGATLGVLVSGLFLIVGFWCASLPGLYFSSFVTIILSSWMSAYYERNRLIPAMVWNLALIFLSVGCAKFLLEFLHSLGWIR